MDCARLWLQTAARLLVRISANLDAFPAHAAAILTSTVVECHRRAAAAAAHGRRDLLQPWLACRLSLLSLLAQHLVRSACTRACRAGLAGAAYTHATRLMQPELKAALNPAYKRKIEGLVRRRERCDLREADRSTCCTQRPPPPRRAALQEPGSAAPSIGLRCRGEDPDEEVQACPFCEVEGSEWDLQCASCQADIPFCIASGATPCQCHCAASCSRARRAQPGQPRRCAAGRRMTLRDWAQCPSCLLPARGSSLAAYAAAGQPCPVCAHSVASLDAHCVGDPAAALAAATGVPIDRGPNVKAAVAAYSQMHLSVLAA